MLLSFISTLKVVCSKTSLMGKSCMQAFIDLLIFTNKYTNANECQKIGLFVFKTDMSNNSNIDVK